MHGEDVVRDIKEKIEKDCTSERPNAFWKREKYFVDLPYNECYKETPMSASANHMSPT